MKCLLLVVLSVFTFHAAQAAPLQSEGWRGRTIYGKYIPKGEGMDIVGEIDELTDTDTQKIVGYHYYRIDRSYFIMANNGQPYMEAWDFPQTCLADGCKDSRMARLTLIPFKNEEFLGRIEAIKNDEKGKFQLLVNGNAFLELDLETMKPVGGFIEEKPVPSQELKDPAIQCSAGVTCIRALAFGRLAQQSPMSSSEIFWADGTSLKVPNPKLFTTDGSFIFRNEGALSAAMRQ